MSTPGSRVLTAANLLTFSRLLAVPAVIVSLMSRADAVAVVVFIVAAVTDFFDGKLARWRGAESELGAMLDPVADRLMLSGAAVVLAARGLLPWPLVALLVGRDVAALAGSLVFRGKIKVNRVGKVATAVLMASVALVMYRPGTIGQTIFYAGIGLSLVAGVMYMMSARRHIWSPR